jgi:hypothetical protein
VDWFAWQRETRPQGHGLCRHTCKPCPGISNIDNTPSAQRDRTSATSLSWLWPQGSHTSLGTPYWDVCDRAIMHKHVP